MCIGNLITNNYDPPVNSFEKLILNGGHLFSGGVCHFPVSKFRHLAVKNDSFDLSLVTHVLIVPFPKTESWRSSDGDSWRAGAQIKEKFDAMALKLSVN